jgi:hypothetical protein
LRCAPSILTLKSAGVRSAMGLPLPSTTVTSSDVTSTEARKVVCGVCAGVCA